MLANGQVFGGDSGYMYIGTYTQQGNTMKAKVHVKQHTAGMQNVMGQKEFDLELDGTLNGNVISVTGTIPGTTMKLNGTLTKQRDLAKASVQTAH
jgi:hypothetical protein